MKLHPVWTRFVEWIEKDYDETEEKRKASTLNLFWFIVAVIIMFGLAIYATVTQPGGIPY